MAFGHRWKQLKIKDVCVGSLQFRISVGVVESVRIVTV
jgi:hypothetical protein